MCVDIFFHAVKELDSVKDYIPDLEIDPQVTLFLEHNPHIQAHARPLAKIIYRNNHQKPILTLMRWGLLREYMFKDSATFKKYAFNSFNARSENVLEKSSTWYSIRTNRCLIDTQGIYEHRKIPGWKNKVPYFVQLANKKRMLIPGLYFYVQMNENLIQSIRDSKDKYMLEALAKTLNMESGEVTGSFCMLTRKANSLMQNIHNDGINKHRMPLFLQPQQAVRWIDYNLSEAEMQAIFNTEMSNDELEAHPVFTLRTQTLRPDRKEKNEYFNWPGLPALDGSNPGELFG